MVGNVRVVDTRIAEGATSDRVTTEDRSNHIEDLEQHGLSHGGVRRGGEGGRTREREQAQGPGHARASHQREREQERQTFFLYVERDAL